MKTSSCCGSEMTQMDVDKGFCPTCKEHCSAEEMTIMERMEEISGDVEELKDLIREDTNA